MNPVSTDAHPTPPTAERWTLRTIRQRVRDGQPFAMLTCYDATTARWLWRGGLRAFLVGDTAAQVILGYDSTLPAAMDFMVQITAAVRRGAPDAFIMADMPFGSYQCGDDLALTNAMRFLKESLADVVKLEVDDSFAPLVARMAHAGIPVVAHLGSRPQQVRRQGGYRAFGRTPAEARQIINTARLMIEHGAAMLLLEAVPNEVAQEVVRLAENPARTLRRKPATRTASFSAAAASENVIPVVGCGAGPACHGHVIVLHDLLGLSDWHPPFAPPLVELGPQILQATRRWIELVESRRYLKDNHPYKMITGKP